MDIAAPISHTKVDTTYGADLKNFLSRPTKIHEFTWSEGVTIPFTAIDPWTLYFDDIVIRRKLDNYAFMRCNLKIKVVINASPFYYGCLLFAYQPLPTFNPVGVPLGAGLEFVPLSQRPHIYAYPQNCQGGSMTLPFLYHKQWLPTTSSAVAEMGRIEYLSFDDLLNANAVVGSSCDVTLYAWAEDIELAGPTTDLAIQSRVTSNKSKDEYSHEGTISKPASAIARYTGMLSRAPIIGPFMTATSMAADAVSGIANLFGYTNVPVIDDVHYFKGSTTPHLASTDIGHPIDKLTLDSKNELSIDPKICGVSLTDELDISTFASRESWVYSFNWTSSNVADDLIFTSLVRSSQVRYNTLASGDVFYMTPLSMLSSVFDYWRGDIIYRFKIICSQYHKGRLAISWAPTGDPGGTTDTTNQIYSKIVDISKDTDVEFRVPYLKETAYLRARDPNRDIIYRTTPFAANYDDQTNGTLVVKVLNKQTSPVLSADIKILVFVRAAENIEFAAPKDITNRFTPYFIQSKVMFDDDDGTTMLMGMKQHITDPALNLIYHGESICSLRTIMNRSAYYGRFQLCSVSDLNFKFSTSTMSRLPLYPGFDPDGIHTCIEPISGESGPYNYVNWHPLTFFQLAFVGNRGAINWSAVSNSTEGYKISWRRTTAIRDSSGYDDSTVLAKTVTPSSLSHKSISVYPSGNAGINVTQPQTQAAVSVSVPMYNNVKFLSNNLFGRTIGVSQDNSNTDTIVLTTEIQSTGLQIYPGVDLFVSAGADFSLIFFLNAPVMCVTDNLPTPV